MTTDPREDKLPRWAQEQLQKLRREVEDLNSWKSNANIVLRETIDPEQHGGSNVTFSNGGMEEEIPLPRHSRVTWSFGPGTYNEIQAHIDSVGRLVLQAGRTLVIQPRATNLIEVIPGE